MNNILVHYHEIALKGKNRPIFEEKLVNNIKQALEPDARVERLTGRLLVYVKDTVSAGKVLKNIFGISSFSPTVEIKTDMKEIEKAAVELIKKEKGKTFKVITKRNYKQFPKNSMEISSDLGAYILKNVKLKVDIKKPKIIVGVELLKNKTYIYTKKVKGPGGLPVGVSGKMLSLISGGIDSPVASYLMLKRGANVDFVHFHSYPFTDKAGIEKVRELIEILKKYQPKNKLYLVPIIDFQKETLKKSQQKHRIILYRRLMYKIADRIAKENGYKALISGDNLGQVASQTIENMSVIGNGIDTPIMRPLVGFDKEEIIELAHHIGTFETSIEPHGDCCSVFLPQSPATKARLDDILEEEMTVGMEKWIEKIIKLINIQ